MGLWQCRDCGRILAQTGSTFAKATPYKAGCRISPILESQLIGSDAHF